MANDTIRSYESAADITEYWLNNFLKRYFNVDNVNTYRAGTLGYINDILATTTEDAFHAMMIARREVLPNTAQYMKSLYLHAASRLMDAPLTNPASATILLMIQQSDILKYGEQTGDLHTFILDDTFVAWVGNIPFMLDYPVTILSVKKESGKYAHTTHYMFNINNTLNTDAEKYLPNKVINHNGTEYIIMSAIMRQVQKTTETQLVTSNTIVSTVTMDFSYSGNLANFEVFYKENDTSATVQLEKVIQDSVILHKPFCWYKILDENTIRLTFPANAYFVPRLNGTITMNIFTSKGSDGNFDTYDSDIVSENISPNYAYNAQVPVFGAVDGPSSGGTDTMDMEEYRKAVMRAYCTNMTFVTTNDLQLYFDTLMVGTNDRFKFVKKRDDSFVRLHGAFLRMKDDIGNVVPTNTLDIILDPLSDEGDFDIYADSVKRYIIKPGALFTYFHDNDQKYTLKRVKGVTIGEDISDYDSGEHYSCGKCGQVYDGDVPFIDCYKDPDNAYVCPHCGASKEYFSRDRYVFTNPYLIAVSTDYFVAGYFLNSINASHELSYVTVNDQSIVQFIARHFKVQRNAISGENFYRFSIAISPSVELEFNKLIEDRSTEYVIAKHNGYISSIRYEGNAVYATVVYTDDPTLPDDEEIEDKEEIIQASSYVEKVDKTFRICPICGYRMDVDEWAEAESNEFNDGDTTMICPHCAEKNIKTLVSKFEEQYIDFDYYPGYQMNFSVGDTLSKNDVIASGMPKDLGRIRLMMDLGDVLHSDAQRYIPMTIELAHSDNTTYFIFAAYISTNDIIDSSMILSVDDGYVLKDGSSGHTHSISIPIEGLSMQIHAFYQYREDDALIYDTKNPAHAYSKFAYASAHTFTNTYSVKEGDSITLIKPLDHARGFLDVLEKDDYYIDGDDIPIGPDGTDPDDPYAPHPSYEQFEVPDDPSYTYLRNNDHSLDAVQELENDRYDERYLTVLKPGSATPGVPGYDDEPETSDGSLDDDPLTNIPVADDSLGSSVAVPSLPYGGNFLFKLRNCPMISAQWIKNSSNETYFIDHIYKRYADIEDMCIRLENGFALDMKYYNTYGKSKFYKVGNRKTLQVLDSVNITPSFGAAIVFPASAEVFRENFRTFVTEYIEAADEDVGNGTDIYLMNLVAAAKAEFDEIGFLEYYGFNDYDYFAQRISVMSDDEILEVVEPDSFVPEFLNIIRETVNGSIVPKVNLTIIDTEE